ncbi:hypothetical protein D3C84_1088900 [compost metagenome]
MLDAFAAGQALALQQLAGDGQGLFGNGQFGLGFAAFTHQPVTFLQRSLLALFKFGATFVQLLLTGP